MSTSSRGTSNRRLKSTAVAASLTLALAGALTACGSSGGKSSSKSGYAEICADRSRNLRVAEILCAGRGDPNLAWYYVAHECGQSLNPVTGLSMSPGQGSYERPRKGKVVRGGFGQCKSKSSG